MTPERFGELLRRPALLSSQNATELEELIAQYPWCGPLRQLRYRKAVVDGNEADRELWRTRAEPFLSHANLHEQATRLENARPAKAVAHFDFVAGDTATTPVTTATDTMPASELAQVDDLLAVAASAVDTSDWYLHRHGLIMDYGRPKPAPRENFDSYNEWKARRAETSWGDLLRLADKQPRKAKSRKPKRKATVAQPVVASETLAGLLADQGHTDKAIQMYQQLSLRYPAKSTTFAARIEALKQQAA